MDRNILINIIIIILLASFNAKAATPLINCNGSSFLQSTANPPVWACSVPGSGIPINLGTSASVTNPQRSSDPTTGLYSAAANTVSIATAGTNIVTIGTNGMNIANGVLTGASTTNNFLNVTGTLPATPTGSVFGVNFIVNTAGSASQKQIAQQVNLASGYTGSAQTKAITIVNNAAGTAIAGWMGNAANYGLFSQTSSTTAGHNVGVSGAAFDSSSLNLGVSGVANTAVNTPALNVGVGGLALSATTNVGGFFGLINATPTISGSAALIADNGATSSPIFVAQNNGAAVVTVTNTGSVGIGTSIPAAILDVYGSIDIKEFNAITFQINDSGSIGSSISIGPLAMAGLPASSAYNNIAIGLQSLGGVSGNTLTTSAIANIAVGGLSLGKNTSGSNMVAIGFSSLANNTSGLNNNGIGWQSLVGVTTGNYNNALGHDAGAGIAGSGSGNVCIGEGTCYDNGSTSINISSNTAIGTTALFNISNSFNTAVGYQSLYNTGNTQGNTALGLNSGESNTVGANNLFIGTGVGSNISQTGNNNIFIGTDASTDALTSSTNNELNIGNIIYGSNLQNNTNTGSIALIGIGSSLPRSVLDISQNTGAEILPIGTTGQQPATAINGMIRYNTTKTAIEAYQNNVWSAPGNGGNAEQTISYQPGLLTAINATKGVYGKFVKASTLDNIEGSAVTFSCIANPTITLTNCHTDTSCATSPTAMGTVTVTASGQAFDGSISSSAIAAGEYLAWSMTAGTCASIDVSATAQIHAN